MPKCYYPCACHRHRPTCIRYNKHAMCLSERERKRSCSNLRVGAVRRVCVCLTQHGRLFRKIAEGENEREIESVTSEERGNWERERERVCIKVRERETQCVNRATGNRRNVGTVVNFSAARKKERKKERGAKRFTLFIFFVFWWVWIPPFSTVSSFQWSWNSWNVKSVRRAPEPTYEWQFGINQC